MSVPLGREFLRYGTNRVAPGWSQVVMSDQDMYTGYAYAAIRNRANAVAGLATKHVRTESKRKEKNPVHPYLTLIDEAPDFSNHLFYISGSTYLDLEGVWYVMAVRNLNKYRGQIGAIQSLKLLNPYHITRVINKETLQVEGYIESRNGYQREIPAGMIIEMRELNPFDAEKPYAMTDAAKESQFTLKTMSDYTRSSLQNNVNAPGIISTDVILPDAQFANFKARVTNHTKGEPLFANGSGAIKWEGMQVDMDKAALEKVNEINRQILMAVAGTSKTSLGIEESGTTRETARVQRDLNIEGHIIPRLNLMLDALNQDYKTNYPNDYAANGYRLVVDNPLATDHDAELKETDVRLKKYDLYNSLINKGYDEQTAAQYATGERPITELGKPKNPPVIMPPQPEAMPEQMPDEMPEEMNNAHCEHVPMVTNALGDDNQRVITAQQGVLRNAVVNVQERLVSAVSNKVTKNQYEEQSDIVNKRDKEQAVKDLNAVLATFYLLIFPIYGASVMNRRLAEFKGIGSYSFTNDAKAYINALATKVASGHIDTILNDMLGTAREAALQGKSRAEIVRAIRNEYTGTISKTRAEAIARTETNRAFTRAQFEADQQFLTTNNLVGRAYKKWVTRSDNPCVFCKALANEPPIPFGNAFRTVGGDITVKQVDDGVTKVKKLNVGFEDLEAGNAHTNCACAYQLIIE